MAPEQMMGERVDGRADVFSVAAVAYELLTGRAPFPGKTITEVVSRVVHGAHVPPQKADDRLPAALDAVFAHAFAPRPADRYPLALDFARELADAANPALDLEVTPGAEVPAGRTEVPAPTATPTATLPAPPPPKAGPALVETVVLDEAARNGRLFLDLDPVAARAEVDGQGVAPREDRAIIASWGRHVLRLYLEGHETAQAEFELSAGHPVVRLSARLTPKRQTPPPAGFLTLEADMAPPVRTFGDWPKRPEVLAAGPDGRTSASVDVYIRETGEVSRVDEAEGPPELRRLLADAVATWRFSPATRAGVPLPVRLRLQHIFTA
jgi:hypothetical protein